MNTTASVQSRSINSTLRLFEIYSRMPYLSIKHDSYFQVYEEVLSKYVGKDITFVEVGTLNGGSLFMWREYFGPRARVIGIDLNPAARRWQSDGFEIFIGSQSDPLFWRDFYRQVGNIDVLVDDGGHTNRQQIITLHETLGHINDGGTILVEDVHASYMEEFGNPSRFSFVNFAKRTVDSVNSRFPGIRAVRNDYGRRIYSVGFYESIVVFHVDSARCFTSRETSNGGVSANVEDFRHKEAARGTVESARIRLRRYVGFLRRVSVVESAARGILAAVNKIAFVIDDRVLKRFFD